MHGVFINGTTGEWFSQTPDERRLVAETAIDQVAGRVDGRDRLHLPHREAGGRARTACDGRRRRRHRLDAAAVLEDVPRRDGAVLPGHLGRRRRAADGLQLAARRRASTSGPTSRSGSPRSTTSSRSRTARRTCEQFFETTKRVVGERAGVRPLHGRRRTRVPARARGRRVHRRRLAVGRTRRRVLGGGLARRRRRAPASTPGAPTSSSRSSGSPAAGAASSAPTRASSRR